MFTRTALSGSRVLLTGASSGIGHALAVRLAGEGARVVLASRNRERLEHLKTTIDGKGGQALVIPTDVADAAQRTALIEETLARLGGLDILVNNAGVGAEGFFEDAGEERLRTIFEVNFFGSTELTRLAVPHLKQGRTPMIVNVASVLGRRAIPGCVEYCASKFAMVGWSEGLRAELARHGIHVLVVCPGAIQTEFDVNRLEQGVSLTPQTRRRMPADRCAHIMVQAMRQRRNEVIITGEAKVFAWANRVVPRVLDWVLARYARKAAEQHAS